MTRRRLRGGRRAVAAAAGLLGVATLLLPIVPPVAVYGEDAPLPSASKADEARARFERAEVLREEGRFVDAAKAYGEALDADEHLYLAHVRRQSAVAAAGEGAYLVQEYDELVGKRPGDPALVLHRLRLDPPALRLEALTARVKAGANDRDTLLELGRAHLAGGDPAVAKRTLEDVWNRFPDQDEALFLSVEALRRVGDVAGARARLEGVLKQRPEAWEVLLRLARLDLGDGKNEDAARRADGVVGMRPTYVAALLLRSEALSRLGKAEDAKVALETALKVNGEDPETLVSLADLTARAAKEDGLKKAVDLYRKALGLKGVGSLRAFYGLAWAQERLALLPDAANSYREASLLAPMDAGVVNSIGVVLLKQKKFQDATIQFDKAIGLDTQSPEAYLNKAAVLDAQAKWGDAVKAYQKVLAMRGQDKNVRALLNAAFDLEEVSDYKKAEDYLAKVRTLRPEDAEVAVYLGDNLYFQHKWKTAIKHYVDATRLDEKNRFGWRGLGLAQWQDGKESEAVASLEKAKALKADDQTTLLALGDLYLNEVQDLQKSLDNYQAYVKSGGSNPDVPGIIEEIKKEIAARGK